MRKILFVISSTILIFGCSTLNRNNEPNYNICIYRTKEIIKKFTFQFDNSNNLKSFTINNIEIGTKEVFTIVENSKEMQITRNYNNNNVVINYDKTTDTAWVNDDKDHSFHLDNGNNSISSFVLFELINITPLHLSLFYMTEKGKWKIGSNYSFEGTIEKSNKIEIATISVNIGNTPLEISYTMPANIMDIRKK
jgi:hypothetical protein